MLYKGKEFELRRIKRGVPQRSEPQDYFNGEAQ